MLYGKVLERNGKLAKHSGGLVGDTTDTPQGGERVKLSQRTTSPDAIGLLLQEYCVSWAELSSPLRTLPHTAPLTYRHTPLTEVWRKEQQDE